MYPIQTPLKIFHKKTVLLPNINPSQESINRWLSIAITNGITHENRSIQR